MNSLRLLLCLVLLSVTTIAFAQSDAQQSLDKLKALAGEWEGAVTADPPQADMPASTRAHITMRVTSRGNAIVHEMQEPGTPLDPTKYDHPVTMIYMDGDHLNLIHYCDAGNRPHMEARKSVDGKTVEFDFVDLTGGNEYGHMHHVVFTTIDANHHIEDWTYMMPGDKPVHVHIDQKRTN
jgi:phage tail protein X